METDTNVLLNIANEMNFEEIPALWKDIDFNRFSYNKTLYPYQEDALKNALKIGRAHV